MCGCGCGTAGVGTGADIPGSAGANGINGQNAYTTLAAALTIPAIGANVTATVPNAYFMAFGQDIAIGSSTIGMAHFKVAANVTSQTSVVLTFMGYPGDAAPAAVLPIGSVVSPTGTWGLPAPLKVYGSGTPYAITNFHLPIIMGTTSPSLTLTSPGTYLIFSRVKLRNNSAATVAGEYVTINLDNAGNVPIPNATTEWVCPGIVNGVGRYLADLVLPPVVYTTAVITDTVTLMAIANAGVTNAGAYNISEAEIVAIRIS